MLDYKLLADGLRVISAEIVEMAQSGHPGMPLGMADAVSALLCELGFDPEDPDWVNRDRVIFSAGHGCALWYAALYGLGVLKKENLLAFRKLQPQNSKILSLPGHPELEIPGVDMTTGPLGQGVGYSVGMALAERILNSKNAAIDHFTYVICSDGDLMEGISYEAMALAGHYCLKKLIFIWDDNEITIDGSTNLSRSEDSAKRFEAAGWKFVTVDGNCFEDVRKAIVAAKFSNKPTIIACKTKIGKFSNLEGSNKAHGAPLGSENLKMLKENLGFASSGFDMPDSWWEIFDDIKKSMRQKREMWDQNFANIPIFNEDLILRESQELKEKLNKNYATRKHSGSILQELIKNGNVILASADLATSCNTWPENGKQITADDYDGNILPCGVREHAMVAAMAGLTLHGGLIGIASTFLSFYDYARPSIRLAALMKIPLILIATHDSIALGEDGPTHQPIEQIDSFKAMPDLNLFRPADGFEAFYCFKKAINLSGPSIFCLTRQDVPSVYSNFISRHDLYIQDGSARGLIVASGSEVHFCKEIAEELGMAFKSYPFWRFPDSLKNFCDDEKVFIIELSSALVWREIYPKAKILRMNGFGVSGKKDDLLKHFGFSKDAVKNWILSYL